MQDAQKDLRDEIESLSAATAVDVLSLLTSSVYAGPATALCFAFDKALAQKGDSGIDVDTATRDVSDICTIADHRSRAVVVNIATSLAMKALPIG
ncbi:hypothetical protein BSKO_02658 [Bryopsis sp. KO-2023]|nr:hypothetical protein BSKO_02658 [Bryopsis sp. KO-2023]